jgi:LDH2 family malate/lactate/ureidoglycolate dehydrogenase
MATLHGTGTIVIQRCSHIGCLAAYLEEAASRGFLVIIACSDPDNRTVAPFGGTEGVYSPNPLALGIPAEGDPIIIDVSMSATSNGLIHQKKNEGRQLEHPWLLTADGKPTTDPETFFQNPPSTILPLGGTESGYKGFALGIMIEALTSALGGYGRVKEPGRWGASTFVQVINPDSMAGSSYFQNEIQNLRDQCLSSKPIHTDQPVRMPGDAGLQRKRFQLQNGLSLRADTLEMLNNLAQSAGLQTLS